jgi:phosphohistidine phosphatase
VAGASAATPSPPSGSSSRPMTRAYDPASMGERPGKEPASHRIQVLRHLKSSWDDPGLDDHDRPLAPRGRRAGKLVRRYLKAMPAPDLVLCSSAKRTVQTWEAVRAAAPEADVEISPALYGADAESLLEHVRELPESVSSVLLIGHNPAIEQFAAGLSVSGAARERMAVKYPTGGLATITVRGPWRELSWAAGQLTEFVAPRDLARD